MDDLISRQTVLEALEKFEKQCWEDMCFRPLMSDARAIIKSLPSVEPKQMTGQWIINSDGYYPYCSICKNETQGRIMTDYCPNCGAKMGGEK